MTNFMLCGVCVVVSMVYDVCKERNLFKRTTRKATNKEFNNKLTRCTTAAHWKTHKGLTKTHRKNKI